MRIGRFFWTSCLSMTLLFLAGRAPAAESPIGKKIADFSLRDYRGKSHALADYADRKVIVVAFLGTECPLVRLYATRLNLLAKEWAPKGVQFLGVNSNSQDSLTEVAAYARIHGIEFPILKDVGNAIADRFGAVRTPEMFVLDQDRVIRYWGRIDDQYGVGYQRPRATREDLKLAVEALVEGKPVEQPLTPAPGCFIGRVKENKPRGTVTYSGQVARIFQERCVSCHRPGEIAPFPMTSYDEIVGWSQTIREVITDGRMPPWFADPQYGHFSNDTRLSESEKEQIFAWIDNGCPEGNPAETPTPVAYAEGWAIPEPDEVVYMSDQSVHVPAEGVVEYKHFAITPSFKEDKWFYACEARPGNRGVVHHILVFMRVPDDRRSEVYQAEGNPLTRGSLIAAYAPGTPPMIMPEGYGVLIPAGSQIIFQMHYTPNGSPQEDRSYVGFAFRDAKDVKHAVRSGAAMTFVFGIPPGAKNQRVVASTVFDEDRLLLSMSPHMHLRGKSFRYEAKYPDGKKEILLDVPKWDFNWQLQYLLKEPKLMPKGTRLQCTAHYDNSAENLSNPDPKAFVHFGEQTWEEMMIGFFSSAAVEERKP